MSINETNPSTPKSNQPDNDTAENLISQNDFADQQFKDDVTEQALIDAADEASEPSLTLHPEKGISPDPEPSNGKNDDDYNLKQ